MSTDFLELDDSDRISLNHVEYVSIKDDVLTIALSSGRAIEVFFTSQGDPGTRWEQALQGDVDTLCGCEHAIGWTWSDHPFDQSDDLSDLWSDMEEDDESDDAHIYSDRADKIRGNRLRTYEMLAETSEYTSDELEHVCDAVSSRIGLKMGGMDKDRVRLLEIERH